MMKFLILFLFSTFIHVAVAADICDTIFRSSNVGCTDLSSSHSSGGSFPLLFDAFNFSPSALPTFETPVGIEAYYNDNRVNAAFIKGKEHVGFGASVKSTDTTFFSGADNYKVALKNSQPANYRSASLNEYYSLGTALDFIKLEGIINLPIGIAYRINPSKGIYSLQPGLEFRTTWLTLSASAYTEKPKQYYDGFFYVNEKRSNFTMNVDLRFRSFILDYAVIAEETKTSYSQGSMSFSGTSSNIRTQIVSGTFVYDKISLTAAYRSQNSSNITSVYSSSGLSTVSKTHFLAGGAYKTQHIEAGAFYNYVLNEDISAVLKIFF